MEFYPGTVFPLFIVKVNLASNHVDCVASVPFGLGAKKDRGTGFSLFAAREMKQEPLLARCLTLVPRSLLLNRTETLAAQATNLENSCVTHQKQLVVLC